MKIKIDKKTLISKFITPVSKVAEKCIVTLTPNHISTLVSTSDSNPILYACVNVPCDLGEEKQLILNIPNVNKLTKILNCITSDVIELDLNSNNIEYNSLNMNFKYHLLEDGVIEKVGVNPDKIKALEFDTTFVISNDKTEDIIRSASFTTDSNKIYFYTKDNNVYCELTDKEIANIDSVSYFITDTYTGVEFKKPMLIDLEIFKLLYGLKENITTKINLKNKLILFEIKNDIHTLQYIVSTLVK